MNKALKLSVLLIAFQWSIIGCVSHIYKPGTDENLLNQIELGQTYGEMVKILGEPDKSRTEDRTAKEMIILFIPIWNIVELIRDYNPTMMQVYTYNKWGIVTVDNNNRIIQVEAK